MKKLKFEYRITFIYLLIGCLWILFSDLLLKIFVTDIFVLSLFQMYKGWLYVFVTGLLFFLFLKTHLKRLRIREFELYRAKENAEKRENQYRDLYTLMRLMSDTMADMLWAKDLNNNYIFANKAMCNNLLSAVDTNEPIGKSDLFFATREREIHSDEPNWHTFGEICADTDTIVLQNMKAMQFDEYGNVKNQFLFLDVHKAPLYDIEGKLIGVVGSARDVTKQKQSEIELVRAKEKAEESDRLKSAFLANMSHEIRTPMNGILGFSALLKKPNLNSDKQQQFIGIIEKSGIRMLNIINDIIDISKIASGQMSVNFADVNINNVLNELYSFFLEEVTKKSIELKLVKGLLDEQAQYSTDTTKFYAILTNLLKNAIKFTENGIIEFGYSINSTKTELLFYVKDTGIGIPEDKQAAIFERFIQADIDDKMARQGAGLGLSISRAYVEMLDGKIWVESMEKIGSTFYFTLPFKVEEQKIMANNYEIVVEKHNNHSDKVLKVLIVEDDASSAMLLSLLIDKYTKELLNACNGIEAVEICRNNPDIDLILMDVQLPTMNGYEATKCIREFNQTVIIIAQTAFAFAKDREIAKEAGCNDYISKPINENEFATLIDKYFF